MPLSSLEGSPKNIFLLDCSTLKKKAQRFFEMTVTREWAPTVHDQYIQRILYIDALTSMVFRTTTFNIRTILNPARRVYLFILYGSQNKQLLITPTTLNDRFL